jgi:hypothetical protein
MSEDRDPFVPIGFAARTLGRSHRTIRTWARDDTVRRRDDADGVKVHVGDAARAAQTKAKRRRLPDGGSRA